MKWLSKETIYEKLNEITSYNYNIFAFQHRNDDNMVTI